MIFSAVAVFGEVTLTCVFQKMKFKATPYFILKQIITSQYQFKSISKEIVQKKPNPTSLISLKMQLIITDFESFLGVFHRHHHDFVAWIVTFYQLMLVVTGVMHEADNAYSIQSTWLCYRLVRFLITAYIC